MTCLLVGHVSDTRGIVVTPPNATGSSSLAAKATTPLIHLDLTSNNFFGPIPPFFSTFPNLRKLSLVFNLLDDVVLPSLFNITTLKTLNLSFNPFLPSLIPHSLSNLVNLETLWLSGCNLVGPILDSLRNLVLDFSINNLYGPIPSSLTRLTALTQIEFYNNSFFDQLPKEMSNLTSLRLIDRVAVECCKLAQPLWLRLFGNKLIGKLLENLGKNALLKWLDVFNNWFFGRIPRSLCEHGKLEELRMLESKCSEKILTSLGGYRSLSRVRLGTN
ncbi:Receptor-like protein kinase HSL1 [Glycine max]|nr:Receptor-like protein kinase HSL1 [Glycine max]